ncbi:hypothetical protein GCM10022267_69820 [Lentzea roselyniae]|uniref:Uncharacterized protein n=1 Tax=Lentzea roselyniae TaxID=531940 RepID=A0ABP7C0D5_9PSEU|nr:hypothetical protein [Lentzea atacamensis]
MTERDLTSGGAQAVLGLSVLVLLSCAVGNVLLAVTESVWWPLFAGVSWWGAAASVVIRATAATTSRAGTPRVTPAWMAAEVPARRG